MAMTDHQHPSASSILTRISLTKNLLLTPSKAPTSTYKQHILMNKTMNGYEYENHHAEQASKKRASKI
jgi:hypothetical protein